MRILIIREIESMIYSWQELIRTYSLLGIGAVFVMWVMGPRMLGIVSTESSYLLLSTIGLVLAFGRLTVGLERDEKNHQQTFLQLLPIPKTHIVHAKFTGSFLLSLFTVIWIVLLFCLNMLVNGGKAEYWMSGALFTSMFVFVIAMSLLWCYIWGVNRLNTLFFVLLGLWVAVFSALGLLLGIYTGLSFVQVMGLAPAVTVMIFVICWILAVKRVNRKGIPQEKPQAEDPAE